MNDRETYDAYAPLPIVFDTMRNGKSRGKGSSWLWNGGGAMVRIHRHRGGHDRNTAQRTIIYGQLTITINCIQKKKESKHVEYPINCANHVRVSKRCQVAWTIGRGFMSASSALFKQRQRQRKQNVALTIYPTKPHIHYFFLLTDTDLHLDIDNFKSCTFAPCHTGQQTFFVHYERHIRHLQHRATP